MLSVEGITAFYGPAQALFGVDLRVDEGRLVALMGRNGMGKTTTIRAICGMTPARSGVVRFRRTDVTRWRPHRIARAGVGLVPEGRRCFAPLSVSENLAATARPGPWDEAKIYALFPALEPRKRQVARTLSGGEQQMLAIGRALMTNPSLLILDEATEGLAPVIRAEIWRAVKALKAEGQSTLIVDKTLSTLLEIADACVVIERGRTIWSGAPEALSAETELVARSLGV